MTALEVLRSFDVIPLVVVREALGGGVVFFLDILLNTVVQAITMNEICGRNEPDCEGFRSNVLVMFEEIGDEDTSDYLSKYITSIYAYIDVLGTNIRGNSAEWSHVRDNSSRCLDIGDIAYSHQPRNGSLDRVVLSLHSRYLVHINGSSNTTYN
jgi:hypothetical protein